jgi:hypothetical protein
MSRLAEVWRQIASGLGLDIVAPFRLVTAQGSFVDVDALLRNFGGEHGTLLVDDYSKIEKYTQPIVDAGYGYSVLPWYSPSHRYDPDIIMDMLAEWTWTGPVEARPKWLDGRPTEELG